MARLVEAEAINQGAGARARCSRRNRDHRRKEKQQEKERAVIGAEEVTGRSLKVDYVEERKSVRFFVSRSR